MAELLGCQYPNMIPSSQKICGDSGAGQGTPQGERGSPRAALELWWVGN